MIRKILNIRKTVHDILIEFPDTRNNDRLLMLKVWKIQDPNLKDMTMNTFATFFIDGTFADPESIRRNRQDIQGNNPGLRGTSHIGRQKESTRMAELFTQKL